jgi:hypothetical protein
MNLGILVVYLVDEENEALLDLHLRQIESCTTVPYTLYAAVNRLPAQFIGKLQHHSHIKICECLPTDLRGKKEHSFYLECLVREAIQDTVTHIVTLHVDSFPIRRGWIEDLTQRLSPSCPLVTLNRMSTACLLFPRDFYVHYCPRFLLSEADRSSDQFKLFCEQWNPIDHSGTGYGFKAFCEGFSMSYLKEGNTNAQDTFGIIYEDLMFHLVGAAGIGLSQERKNKTTPRSLNALLLSHLRRVHRPLNASMKRLVKLILPASLRRALSEKVYSEVTAGRLYKEAREELLSDPEAYWEYLRTGRRK